MGEGGRDRKWSLYQQLQLGCVEDGEGERREEWRGYKNGGS